MNTGVKMKSSKIILWSLAAALFAGTASAQELMDLQRELQILREDVMYLQKESYEMKNQREEQPADAGDISVKLGEYDETIRNINGRLDVVEFNIKELNGKLNKMNKDFDIRFKMLEGVPITGGEGEGVGTDVAGEKFKAPVAVDAPKSVTGDAVEKGNDLPEIKGKSAEEIYKAGLEALKAADYPTAEANFESILIRFPEDRLAGNAQYWIGEVYYGRKEYQRAAVAFAKGYENYKDGSKGADSLLKLGMSMRELKKNADACAAFTSLKTEFPQAPEGMKKKAAEEARKLNCK